MQSSNIFLVIIVLFFFGILFSIYRNKILHQISLRNFLRRKGTTILIIFGSLVGTALIAGSLTLGDSFSESTRLRAKSTLGEVDVVMKIQSGNTLSQRRSNLINEVSPYFSDKEADSITTLFEKNKVDATAKGLVFSTSLIKGSGNITNSLSVTDVDLIAFNNQDFASEKINFNVANGKTIVSEEIAKRLDLKVGDKIKSFNGIKDFELEVQGINYEQGVKSFSTNNGNIVVSRQFLLNEFNIPSNSYNALLVSAKGGVFESSYNGKEFTDYLVSTVKDQKPQNGKWSVNEYKSQFTTGGGTLISSAFLAVSLAGIAAGVLLLINIYSMLAEERKSEMGTLRAIALTRGNLVKTFLYEGFFYSCISSFLGVGVGIGIGYVLLTAVINIAKGINQNINIVFSSTPESWIAAFFFGLSISFLTSLISSYRISNINIVSAIRNIPDEVDTKITKWVIAKFILQILILISAIQTLIGGILIYALPKENVKFLENIAPIDAIAGYSVLTGLLLSCYMLSIILIKVVKGKEKPGVRRLIVNIFNLPPLILCCLIDRIPLFTKVFESSLGSSLLFFIGLTIVLTSTSLVVNNLDIALLIIRKLISKLKGINGIVNLALRYAADNKFRTGLTILMFALILFLISFLSVFRITIDTQFEKFAPTSGYDAYVRTNNSTDITKLNSDIAKLNITENIAINKQIVLQYVEISNEDLYGDLSQQLFQDPKANASISVFGLNRNFVNNNPLKLSQRIPEFSSDEEAVKAALETGKYVFLTPQAIGGNGTTPIDKLKLGKEVKIKNGEKEINVIVAGILDQQSPQNYTVFQYSLLTGEEIFNSLDKNFARQNIVSDMAFKFNDSVKSRSEGLEKIQTVLIQYNLADRLFSISAVFQQIADVLRGSIIILQGFLSFSLLVGIAGIAIIMTRSVNERRQQIGMLRSLGFQRSNIVSSFFIEASFIIFLGIVIGIGSGIISSSVFINALNATSPDNQTAVVVPVFELLVIGFIVYLLSVFFTLLPSYQASKLSPVEATNYLD